MTPVLLAPSVAAAVSPAPADDYQAGRELRLSGRAAEAVARLERAARAHPQDADVWLELGLARAAIRDLAGAEEALARAAALAPGYVDVQIARTRVAYFRGDFAEARRRLAAVQESAPGDPEAQALAGQIARAAAEAPRPWRMDAAYSHARLSEHLPDATDATIALTHRFSGGVFATGSIERVHQFGVTDTYIEVLGAGSFGYLAVGGTPGADFRPRWAVRGGLVARPWPLGHGWSVQPELDAGWARYPLGDVRSLHAGLILARGDQLDLRVRWLNVLDERDRYRTGYALRAGWRPASPVRLTLGWSSAPESDEGATVNVRAASASAAFEVGPATTFSLAFVHEMRPVYDRDELTVGFARRF